MSERSTPASPTGTADDVEGFYDRYWAWRTDVGRLYRDAPPLRITAALTLLDELGPGRGRLVDIGCGEGTLGRLVDGYHTVGLDLSPVALKLAAESYDDTMQWDSAADGLPEVARGAAVITCLDVVEHVFDPGRLLSQIRAALAPGGLLILSTPNFAYWRNRAAVLRGRFPDESHVFHAAEHLHYFTAESLEELLSAHGLAVAAVRGAWFDPPRPMKRFSKLLRRHPQVFARELVVAASRDENARVLD